MVPAGDGARLVAQVEALWEADAAAGTVDRNLALRPLRARSWAVRQLRASADLSRAIDKGIRTLADCERVLGADHPDRSVRWRLRGRRRGRHRRYPYSFAALCCEPGSNADYSQDSLISVLCAVFAPDMDERSPFCQHPIAGPICSAVLLVPIRELE